MMVIGDFPDEPLVLIMFNNILLYDYTQNFFFDEGTTHRFKGVLKIRNLWVVS